MSVMEARVGGRGMAARNAAERRKKLILVGLVVLFVALLAFQLPRMLKKGESSATALQSISTTSGTAGAPASHTLAGASAPAAGSAARVHAIRRLAPKDPFVPLIRDDAGSAASSAASPASPAAAVASRPRARRAVRLSVQAPATATRRAVVRAIKPAAPNAAVIVANGHRRVVGVRQAFAVGDITLRLAAVSRKAMRLRVAGGAFAGGKHTLTVRKGHRVTLVNTATGVKYTLRFSAPTKS